MTTRNPQINNMLGRNRRTGVRAGVAVLVVTLGLLLGGCGPREKNVQELMSVAQTSMDTGDHARALVALKSALQQQGANVEVRLMLAKAHLLMAQPVEAEAHLRRALQLGAKTDLVMPLLTQAMFERKDYKQVLDETAAVNGTGKLDLISTVYRGRALMMLGKMDEAGKQFDAALAVAPTTISATVGKAQLALAQGEADAADKLLNDVLSARPDDVDALNLRADIQILRKKPDEAIKTYQSLLKYRPAETAAYAHLVDLLASAKRFEEATAMVGDMRKNVQSAGMPDYLDSIILFKQGRLADARKRVEKANGEMPQFVPAITLAGQIELADSAATKAAEFLQQALNIAPNDHYIRSLLAQAMMLQHQPQKAFEVLKPALVALPYSAPIYTLAGEALLSAGDDRQAMAYLQHAAKLAPDNPRVQRSLALSRLAGGKLPTGDAQSTAAKTGVSRTDDAFHIVQLINQGKHAEGEKLAREMTTRLPKDPLAHNMLGVALANQGKRDGARAAFEQSLQLRPRYQVALGNLAKLDVDSGRPEAARARYDALLKATPGDVDLLVGRADLGLSTGESPATAEQFLQRAHKASPGALQPVLMLAKLKLATGNLSAALDYARKAKQIAPDDRDVLQTLGTAEQQNGDRAALVNTYTQLAALSPDKPELLIQLAKAQADDNQSAAAEHNLEQALLLDPRNTWAHVELALLYAHTKRVPDATRKLNDLRALKLPAAQLDEIKADVDRSAGRGAEAFAAYRTLFQATPAPRLLAKLIDASIEAGKSDEALTLGKRWAEKHQNDVGILHIIADAANRAGKPAVAIEYYETILKQHPDDLTALNNGAQAYVHVNAKRGMELAQRAYKQAPANPYVLDTYGWLLLQTGDAVQGLQHIEQAFRASSNHPEITYHLAAAMAKNGDRTGAKQKLEELLQGNTNFAGIADARYLLVQLRRDGAN